MGVKLDYKLSNAILWTGKLVLLTDNTGLLSTPTIVTDYLDCIVRLIVVLVRN